MNRQGFFTLNAVFLFLAASMYLGTGGSLLFFSFPVASQLTPSNYYLVLVPQVEAATEFFTPMTKAMIASALIMVWAEWRTRMRWVPIVVLLGVGAATWLTLQYILPYNKVMSDGIKDQAVLNETLSSWMRLNKVRVALWTVQWSAMMFYFARLTYQWLVNADRNSVQMSIAAAGSR